MSEMGRNLDGRPRHRSVGDRSLHPGERGENRARSHRAGDYGPSAHRIPAGNRVYEAPKSFQARNPAYSRAIIYATPAVIAVIVIYIIVSEALK